MVWILELGILNRIFEMMIIIQNKYLVLTNILHLLDLKVNHTVNKIIIEGILLMAILLL